MESYPVLSPGVTRSVAIVQKVPELRWNTASPVLSSGAVVQSVTAESISMGKGTVSVWKTHTVSVSSTPSNWHTGDAS